MRKRADFAQQSNYFHVSELQNPPVIQMYINPKFLHESPLWKAEVVPEKKPIYEIVKRMTDIVCSASALILLSPVFAVLAVCIVADNPGQPFFVQKRIGKDGKPFQIYKFRSMYMGAEKQQAGLMSKNECHGATFKMKNDPRVTRFGSFIRRTSLDELPELVNILKGEMSFIGPRPFIPSEQEKLPPDRLSVTPGLSCYWQIDGKNALSITEQIMLDRKYLKERSVKTDCEILVRTILHLLSVENY